VLTFNNRFDGPGCDPKLIDKLRTELPGILARALAAVRGVILRGAFTDVSSSNSMKLEWQLNCDQAAQFFEDRLQRNPGAKVGSTVLYKNYREWAFEQGITRTLTQKSLIQRLVTRHGFVVGRDMRHRYIEGAEFRPLLATNVVEIGERGRRA
jgi:putative DNA primase/helicase